MEPKEVFIQLEEEMLAEFEEVHGREPNKTESAEISMKAHDGIGEYYADLIDQARDRAKILSLSKKDSQAFVAALTKSPGKRLQQAAKRMKEK